MPEDPSQSLARAHIMFSVALATCEVKEGVRCWVPCSTDETFKIMEQVIEHLGVELECATRIVPIRSN